MRALWTSLLDRLNPILLKEVRQAIRGRYFKISYGITLTAAIAISLVIMVAADAGDWADDELGPWFFGWMFGCLAAAVFFWVPFFAFISMGSEWEENTYDLLVLSNLKPRRIVYGKLWSSVVQMMLYFSAFGPFLIFAFLLRGVDLFLLVTMLAGAMVYSCSLSLMAIGISSLSRVRFVRISLMSLMAAILVMMTIWAAMFVVMVTTSPFAPSSFELMLGLVSTLAGGVTLAVFLGEVAIVRLSHPEENRSSGMRLFLMVMVLVALGILLWGLSVDYDNEVPAGVTLTGLFLLLIPMAFFTTEDARLGRRVRLQVPRSRLLALLAVPFLPGGGRGLLYYFLVTAVLVGGVAGIQLLLRGDLSDVIDNGLYSVLGALLYCFLYLALPQTFLASRFGSLRWRIVARLMVPLGAILALLLPTLGFFFLGNRREDALEHVGSSPWVLMELWDDDPDWFYSVFLGLGFVAAFVFAMNVPRMIAGVREVLQASEERREREALARAEATEAPVEVTDAAA